MFRLLSAAVVGVAASVMFFLVCTAILWAFAGCHYIGTSTAPYIVSVLLGELSGVLAYKRFTPKTDIAGPSSLITDAVRHAFKLQRQLYRHAHIRNVDGGQMLLDILPR